MKRLFFLAALAATPASADPLCLDGFCIGQPITAERFGQVAWMIPKEARSQPCALTTCVPNVAFRGYSDADGVAVARALDLQVGIPPETMVTNGDLGGLREYRYECNPAPRGGIFGERRFMGVFRSSPTNYLTAVGLRLIDGQLRVFRIVRRFPYHNRGELASLAQGVVQRYGGRITVVDYLSSNAYSEVKAKGTDGWFGRSEMFNPSDANDNAAELVLVDPRTRQLLGPSSWPDSGEISPLNLRMPPQCSRAMPLD